MSGCCSWHANYSGDMADTRWCKQASKFDRLPVSLAGRRRAGHASTVTTRETVPPARSSRRTPAGPPHFDSVAVHGLPWRGRPPSIRNRTARSFAAGLTRRCPCLDSSLGGWDVRPLTLILTLKRYGVWSGKQTRYCRRPTMFCGLQQKGRSLTFRRNFFLRRSSIISVA